MHSEGFDKKSTNFIFDSSDFNSIYKFSFLFFSIYDFSVSYLGNLIAIYSYLSYSDMYSSSFF